MRDSPAIHESDAPLWLPEDSAAEPSSSVDPWRVLIVDDDEDVHRATELALQDASIEGRPLTFLHAYSAAEALHIISADPTISTILLDVVMETPNAGLRLVQCLRKELQRSELRIILRTGQPGYAPEMETVRDFEINDYCTKADMTSIRLFTSLTTAIRSYRLIVDLQRERDELKRVNASLEDLRRSEQAQAEKLLGAEKALRLANETMEQCVTQRTQELSATVGQLESFNRMVSHDLRGPLSGIAGISTLIRHELQQGDMERIRKWLTMQESLVQRLVGLVEDLLNLSRASHGELTRVRQPLDAVVNDALSMLSLFTPPEQVALIAVDPLPELSIDGGLIRQVFVNLLSNALKFTRGVERPHIHVSAVCIDLQCVVGVSDNGTGFNDTRAAELFTPFGRLHGNQFEGSGIGLAIVRRIIERHGGRVWAENRPGGGAKFCFSVPVDP